MVLIETLTNLLPLVGAFGVWSWGGCCGVGIGIVIGFNLAKLHALRSK